MKLKIIYVIIFLCAFVVLTYFVSNYDELNVKETFSENNSNYTMKNLKEGSDKYHIDIYYPQTIYDVLNIKIKADIQNIVSDFKNLLNEEHDKEYVLEISFDYYEYEGYISFAFNVFRQTGGAHPNTNTFTVNYDIRNNKIIDIVELTKMYPSILKVFSKVSYESLKDNDKILEYGNEEMFNKGIEEKVENFRNFVFDKNNIILFYNPYDIAPYVAGSFVVKIPYDKLENE